MCRAFKLVTMKRVKPVALCKWLGLAYAAALMLFLLWNADSPDVVLFSFVFLPWLVGPAAFAALGARMSQSLAEAWSFFGLEIAMIGSTACLWFYLIAVAPDAQNGIAMMLFPALQYAAVLAFFVVALLIGWCRRGEIEVEDQ
jgi:hypothetical protein